MHPSVNMAQHITYEQHDLIRTHGVGAWTLSSPYQLDGKITRNRDSTTEVKSNFSADLDKTLISSLAMLWGRYNPLEGAKGVYYEVEIEKLARNAVVALGFGCLPYPTDFRLPGWHRQSAAVHSDDGFKFFENSDGGIPFMNPIKKHGILPVDPSWQWDFVGVGIYYPSAESSGSIFYTLNGHRIPQNAFSGAFFPRENYDVFAMVGISGEVRINVNFGAQARFKWHEGNELAWKVGQENFDKPRMR
jgi:Ran-binding protein 9/10